MTWKPVYSLDPIGVGPASSSPLNNQAWQADIGLDRDEGDINPCWKAWPADTGKALARGHSQTGRQFFALANQHTRWNLNDLTRRLDD